MIDLLVVTALAALTRLWALFSPRAVVFDEVHTLRFVHAYLTRTPYFDVHPPLGVQLFALEAKLFGMDAGAVAAGATSAPVVLRLLPAILGALLAPLVVLLVRRVGGSRRAALLAGCVVAFDNALVVQSRFMLTDLLLVSFGVAAVVLWLAWRAHGGRTRWMPLAAAGALAGMSASVKWTGLSALGLMLLVEALDAWRERRALRGAASRVAVLAASAIAVYLVVFAIHFAVFHDTHGTFATRLIDQHARMLAGNRGLEATHHFYASPWYTWPLMIRPIHYWMQDLAAPRAIDIYLLGNPLAWWGSFVVVLLGLIEWARRRGHDATASAPRTGLLAAGWAMNFLPFAFIGRLMYLYHYLHALVFAIAFSAVWIGARAGWGEDDPWRMSRARRDVLFWALLAGAALLFLFFAPITYGMPLTPGQLKLRLWLPGWG